MLMNDTLRILNLEDSPYDTELIQARLDEDGIACEIMRVDTKEDYIHALEEIGIDLILADYSLPGFDGISALELAVEKRPEIPFLFVSGVIGEDLAIVSLKRGATDYVLKNRLQRLGPAVRRAILENRERIDRKKAEEELRHAHAELERRVEERTAELFKLTKSLQEEIAERKRAEEELAIAKQAAEKRAAEAEEGRRILEAMMEHIPLGITIADSPDARIRAVSRFGRELTGRSREQIEGIPVDLHAERWQIFHADGATLASNEELPLTRATLKGEIVLEEEWVLMRGNGTRVPILCTAAPITDAEGHIIGGVMGWQDISSRKQAEEERERLILELERSNRELEQFAYIASHDLQEPLRMVSNYVQLLARRYIGKLDTQADQFINFAEEGAMRMQKLIEALLAYSRIVTHGADFASVNMDEVFVSAVSNFSLAIRESRAVVSKDALPVVSGDESQLMQLLQNLIGNAIKFRKPDVPLKVHVSVQGKGHEWVFSISDNGIGIKPQYFDRIFLIFQRLHTRVEYPGTGIGLAVCKRIIERHRGRIWVQSTPGEGTTFFFSIPNGGRK